MISNPTFSCVSHSMHLSLKRLAALALCTFLGGNIGVTLAADSLRILPTRVVLEPSERGAELNLINNGDSLGTYRILLRNLRTDENGTFTTVEEPSENELFADKLVRFSPRQVTVEPQSNQKVRLIVRKPKGLASGEYRTHMVFQSIPQQEFPSVYDQSEEVSVQVSTIVEITIPVIVRHGKLDASVSIENVVRNDKNITLELARKGSRSLYGDLEVLNAKTSERVQFMRGVAVYYPNERRRISMDVEGPMKGYTIKFIEDQSYGGDQTAEHSF